MIELKKGTIINTELFVTEKSSIYFNCVLDGSMDGRVWVDSLEHPTFGVVWNEYQEGFQVIGSPVRPPEYSGLRLFFDTTIIRFLKEKEIKYLEIGADTDELSNMLFYIFKDRKIESEHQKVFKLRQIIHPSDDSIKTLENKFNITPIDEIFLKSCFNNMDYVTEEINNTWGGIELYLNNGYGYAAVFENEIVGKALITCSYHQFDNISVDTIADYRRQGISSNLAYRTLFEGYKRGRSCVWDCAEDNIASAQTALKIGFKRDYKYTVIWYKIE